MKENFQGGSLRSGCKEVGAICCRSSLKVLVQLKRGGGTSDFWQLYFQIKFCMFSLFLCVLNGKAASLSCARPANFAGPWANWV